MATERELLFNVASCKSADRNRPPVAMAQVQPHPKGFDRAKRVCASRVLLQGAHDSCPTRTFPVRKRFVKPKLPHIFTDSVVFSGQTTVLISSPLHCFLISFLMTRCREREKVYTAQPWYRRMPAGGQLSDSRHAKHLVFKKIFHIGGFGGHPDGRSWGVLVSRFTRLGLAIILGSILLVVVKHDGAVGTAYGYFRRRRS